MRTLRAVLSSVLLVAMVPTLALAQRPARSDQQLWSGVGLITGGLVSTIFAFNYTDHCGLVNGKPYAGSGTLVDLGSGTPKKCVFSGRYSVSVSSVRTEVDLARPVMLYAGLGAVAAGIVVLAVPPKVRKYSPEVGFSPTGVTATKTLRW